MNPTRCCIVCKKRKPKKELLRIVVCDGNTVLDESQKTNARGIYICRDQSCFKKLTIQLNKNKMTFKIPIKKESLIEIIKKVESELEE